MLQITSGKFFDPAKEIQNTPSEVVLYSNLFIAIPMDLGIGTLRLLHHEGPYCQYSFRYSHLMEREGGRGLVVTGEETLVEQLAALLGFFLKAYFSPRLDSVESACSASASRRLVATYLEQGRSIEMSQHTACREFIAKTIGLSRSDFLATTACCMAVHDALAALHTNNDLAYSLLVFGTETMAQRSDDYEPSWEDYPRQDSLDAAFTGLPEDKVQAIKDVLLADTNLKNKKRFENFILSHLGPSYFGAEAAGLSFPLRKSEVPAALDKVYFARSKYAHTLQEIQRHLTVPQIAAQDVFRWKNVPYLSFNGLLRLLHHALINFVSTRPTVGREDIDWLSQTPSIIQLQVGPENYIFHSHNVTANQVQNRLQGYLELAARMAAGDNRIADLRPVLEELFRLYDQTTAENKRLICLLAEFWRSTIRNGPLSEQILAVLDRDQGMLASCTQETMILGSLRETLNWSAGEMASAYTKYEKNRVKPNKPSYPQPFDLLVMLHIALRFGAEAKPVQRRVWLEKALCDAPGILPLQEAIQRIIDGADCPSPYAIIFPQSPAAPEAAPATS